MKEAEPLRVVLWADEFLDPLAERLAIEGAVVDVVVDRVDRSDCVHKLAAGLADVALIPTVTVLSDDKSYDIYPAVAVSYWCAPTARILLRQGFGQPAKSLACDRKYLQEALMARIVLREHYGMEPEQIPVDVQDDESLLKSVADAVLLTGHAADRVDPVGVMLDLGQEWFEYTNYPMVWGLFVSRRDEADPRVVRLLRAAVADLEVDDAPATDIEDLIQDRSARYRLDDLATASLSELADLLFFYQIVEEVPAVQFALDPDAVADDEADDMQEFEI